ncbi:hypothetical protein H2199_007595 [Coniosporium tulheliwenetii]|uniref:Uncharacterized protein n=1 Tax=Coniosporium tulheliwenetii TaxID=3383036 RepID=A0ACC2YPW2_9PEZI|nr:hypothetical protein H2199_007595 [Cladosporium sp. JES 115]
MATTAKSRLSSLVAHFIPISASPSPDAPSTSRPSWQNYTHTLSPTYFLPRAAAIEPSAPAIYHVTANKRILRRSYGEAADRARGFAYFLLKHGYKRVGILAPNTPAFLEAMFGIGAAGAVSVAINYRLKTGDIAYIFEHAEADLIIVDAEYAHLLEEYKEKNPSVPVVVDTDTDAVEGS